MRLVFELFSGYSAQNSPIQPGLAYRLQLIQQQAAYALHPTCKCAQEVRGNVAQGQEAPPTCGSPTTHRPKWGGGGEGRGPSP